MKTGTLNKKWKELLYAFSGFGPNLLMVMMMAYFTDAIRPGALDADKAFWSFNGSTLVFVPLFIILWPLAKAFDGIVDVPLASLTDNLKTKWGRRRPTIAVCLLPMMLSYGMCWYIPFDSQVANTFWVTAWALVFFTTYTMCLISYYGSLSTVCVDESQKIRVSINKSIFDTISYAVAYAIVPAIPSILKAFNMTTTIDKVALFGIPLMLTMLIPLFMIKEGDKYEQKCRDAGIPFKPLADEPTVGIIESITITAKNKLFLKWLLVNCCVFFGLQMFLVSQNAIISGLLKLGTTYATILNTCAFAPVPIMLFLFNKLKKKKGIRFTFQTCLLSFAVAILGFDLASNFIWGDNNILIQVLIAGIGGVIGSWAIGAFFMMPYMVPTQISSVETRLTGKNHSAMYFAAQALTTTIIGAISGGLIYEGIKEIKVGANEIPIGLMLVPVIVAVFCVIGFFLCYLMPKNFTPKAVAKELGLEAELEKLNLPQPKEGPFEDEGLAFNIFVWILSGGIFGLIWRYGIMSKINKLSPKKNWIIHYIISIFIPPYFAYVVYSTNKRILKEAEKYNVRAKNLNVLYVLLALICINLPAYIIMQKKLNDILKPVMDEMPEPTSKIVFE